MNYQHVFHAGNHADVLKHTVLLAIMDSLQLKPGGFLVLDTHAGQGAYDLASEQSQKTGEYASGIGKIWGMHGLPDALTRYLQAVAVHNPDGQLRHYPGSPLLIADALRGQDHLSLCDIVESQADQLRQLFRRDKRVTVLCQDGYQSVRALLPPRHGDEKITRALVLIDPPYEAQFEELDRVLQATQEVLQRFAQSIIVAWYPIKQGRDLHAFYRKLSELPCKGALRVELLIRPDDSSLRLNGSGCIVFNPPWQLDQQLRPAIDVLARLIGESGASARTDFLIEPA